MPQFNIPRFERVCVGPQTAVNLIPNAGGVWDPTTSKLLRSGTNGCKLKATSPLIPVPWKTGTRSTQPGILGRKAGTFSLNSLPVIAAGTGNVGVAPDMDLVLRGIFGQAPTISAGVSVTYTFVDATWSPFVLGRFQHLQTSLGQQFAYGCTPEQATWTLNGDVFSMNVSGTCFWVLDSENFANEDTPGKGGLTAFPLEPTSPTVLGAIQVGFQGIATFDSNVMDPTSAPVISCSVGIRTGNILYMDNFGNTYPSTQGGAERMVTVGVNFQDSNSASLNNLKVKAKQKTPMNLTLQVGTTAGSIHTFTINQVQLNIPDYNDDNARVTTNFGESPAHATAIGSVDDLIYVIT